MSVLLQCRFSQCVTSKLGQYCAQQLHPLLNHLYCTMHSTIGQIHHRYTLSYYSLATISRTPCITVSNLLNNDSTKLHLHYYCRLYLITYNLLRIIWTRTESITNGTRVTHPSSASSNEIEPYSRDSIFFLTSLQYYYVEKWQTHGVNPLPNFLMKSTAESTICSYQAPVSVPPQH